MNNIHFCKITFPQDHCFPSRTLCISELNGKKIFPSLVWEKFSHTSDGKNWFLTGFYLIKGVKEKFSLTSEGKYLPTFLWLFSGNFFEIQDFSRYPAKCECGALTFCLISRKNSHFQRNFFPHSSHLKGIYYFLK